MDEATSFPEIKTQDEAMTAEEIFNDMLKLINDKEFTDEQKDALVSLAEKINDPTYEDGRLIADAGKIFAGPLHEALYPIRNYPEKYGYAGGMGGGARRRRKARKSRKLRKARKARKSRRHH